MRSIGIILAGGDNSRMRELSNQRAVCAMPVAGSYRAIDFALSSMTNSGIMKVAVLTQYNARSLNEHLSSSKWWNFGRKQGGLYLFPPTVTKTINTWYRGTADAIWQNLDWLEQCHEPYVVIASGDGIYKLDFQRVLEYHIDKRADVTVVCTDYQQSDVERFGVLDMDADGRIREFEEKPSVASSSLVSTGIYVVRRRQLIEM
ncbi:MAG: glucose-1-phosphate adenylyltransferase family protein, partial [Lachnospiraceae bacterium]